MGNTSRGLGSTLAVGAQGIGTVTKIGSPTLKRDAIDITTLSATNGYKDFLAGLADPGNLTVEGYFDTADTGQNSLKNKFDAGTIDTYTLTFPTVTGASWTASCFIKELTLGDEADLTKAIGFKMTLQIKGLSFNGTSGTLAPTFAIGVYAYSYTFITTTALTLTPTAASQQYTMYVDGVSQGLVNGGSVSAAIAFATAGSHKIDLIVSQAGYSPVVYTIIAVRTA